jgi:threonine dehydrogenase-like Zn-dependent dehydrogenase
LYPTKETEFVTSAPNIDKFKVAIIGAGAAGLFTAMIFDLFEGAI